LDVLASILGSVASVAAWRLIRGKVGEIEIDDGLECGGYASLPRRVDCLGRGVAQVNRRLEIVDA